MLTRDRCECWHLFFIGELESYGCRTLGTFSCHCCSSTRRCHTVTFRSFCPFYPSFMANPSPTEENKNEEERPQKKIKITASNGRRVLQQTMHSRLDKADIFKSAPRRVGMKGRLARLLALPLDLLFEILGHLLPIDILHLTRTSKEFRCVLLHKSATSVWESALANVPDLPKWPPEMSLPAWTNLVFDTNCHNCGIANVRNVVDFILRTRLCGKCAKTCLVSMKKLDKKNKWDQVIRCCIPFSDWAGRGIQCCLLNEKENFIKQLDSDCNPTEFIDEKKLGVKARVEHGKKSQEWLDDVVSSKNSEQDDIKRERREAISKKLVDLGYAEELDELDILACGAPYHWPPLTIWLFNDHPDVKVPKPLTDRTWCNIKDEMIAYMGAVKAHRADRKRLQVISGRTALAIRAWSAWRREDFTTEFMPSLVDVLNWECVKNLVNLPSTENIHYLRFLNIFQEEALRFITKWRGSALLSLRSLCPYRMLSPMLLAPRFLEPLRLAICVFTCEGTIHMEEPEYDPDRYSGMWYPEFLHHPCNSVCWIVPFREGDARILDENSDLRLSNSFSGCRRSAWSTKRLVFDDKASRTVQKILAECKLDPDLTTVEALDKLDPRLVCLKCSFGKKPDGERRLPVRSWRSAVQHCMEVHWGDSQVTWKKISDEDAIKAMILEHQEPARRMIAVKPERIWRCISCIDTVIEPGTLTMDKMRDHQRWRHHKMTCIKEGVDYYRAPERPPWQPLMARMIPKETNE